MLSLYNLSLGGFFLEEMEMKMKEKKIEKMNVIICGLHGKR